MKTCDIIRTDNSGKIKELVNQNMERALVAMCETAVEAVAEAMLAHDDPVYLTGGLMRDVRYRVNTDADSGQAGRPRTADIGNTLEYAVFVHEGTVKMTGRAYLRDGLIPSADRLEAAAANELRKMHT